VMSELILALRTLDHVRILEAIEHESGSAK
jgi:hypothetical protein